jgi:hypothetical protein
MRFARSRRALGFGVLHDQVHGVAASPHRAAGSSHHAIAFSLTVFASSHHVIALS